MKKEEEEECKKNSLMEGRSLNIYYYMLKLKQKNNLK